MDVGARADLKTEVLKDLEKKHVLGSYRGNPAVSDVVLIDVQIESCFAALSTLSAAASPRPKTTG
jgi:cell division protein ZapD